MKKLPLGNSSFISLRLANQIYVDKTRQIYKLASQNGKFFLARPRRFGKSLLVSTFESLFKDGLQYFEGLEIETLWEEQATYKTIRLDFSEAKEFKTAEEFLRLFDSLLVRRFGMAGFKRLEDPLFTICDQLSDWLATQPPNSLVILIDEYDAPLTTCFNQSELLQEIRKILAGFYAVLKSNDEPIRFLFITGITKFAKTNFLSELNNLSDLSLDPEFGALLGYTKSEIEKYFQSYLVESSNVLGISQEVLLAELSKHYDGYCFDRNAENRVFVPWSILKFFSSPKDRFLDYWIESGSKPSALLDYMQSQTFKNPKEYEGVRSIPLSTLDHPSSPLIFQMKLFYSKPDT